jgi:hypothetical protein
MKKKTEKKSSNITLEKLSNLPFKSAKAHKDAQDQIKLQIWHRLEEAKVISEMLQREDYEFWHREFGQGLTCQYVEENDSSLVKVYSVGNGIKISINKALAGSAPLGETILSHLVKTMSETFADTYYRAKGILPTKEPRQINETEE